VSCQLTPTLRNQDPSMNRIIKILPSIALLLAIFGGPALGEGIITGGISGSTVDQTEAVIPGASIKVVSESSGTTFQVASNAKGQFQIPDVPLGSYIVRITACGFGQASVSHVHVVEGHVTSICKQSLSLGDARQTVEVFAGAALVFGRVGVVD
jgi:hypothetical protein